MLPKEEAKATESPAPTKMEKVLITVSLDIRPVTSAVEQRQSPNPKGAKMGAKIFPNPASILSPLSAT